MSAERSERDAIEVAGPCGSWRVLRYIEGNAAEERWCERIEGPCPFPGTDKGRGSERRWSTCPVHGRCSCATESAAPYDLKCPLHGAKSEGG